MAQCWLQVLAKHSWLCNCASYLDRGEAHLGWRAVLVEAPQEHQQAAAHTAALLLHVQRLAVPPIDFATPGRVTAAS